MSRTVYTGAKTREISFPLGGIGTGCVGLAGNGALVDWEIFNRPNKGGLNGFSHFAVKAEAGGKVLDARVLNGDLPGPYTGSLGVRAKYQGYGFGPLRQTMAGMPHFRDVTFRGEFPLAGLTFAERRFPGRVTMKAFNPLIPLNVADSSIPAAMFEIEVTNTTKRTISYTAAGTLGNPLPAGNVNRVRLRRGATLLHLACDSLADDALEAGELTLATDATDVSYQEYWFRGSWFDELETFWRDFTAPGPLANRRYSPARAKADTNATLAARVRVGTGKTRRVRFVIAWRFANCGTYWRDDTPERAAAAGVPATWRNHYATVFRNSLAAATYALANWDRLADRTRLFSDTLQASTLPAAAIEAVSANIAVLKTPTVLRLADGTFYGWEGLHPNAGCCEGSCTHVWNYAQALAFLFPSLERTVREANYAHNQGDDGGMAFRLMLPLGTARSPMRPCADGQFGDVMKLYRDWKICGDTEWLRSLWPAVKASIAYAWSPDNGDRWDPNRTGVLTGRQHHTLDMELFGPNSWLTGFYLGALKAAAEMAAALGEDDTAGEYRDLFARGKAFADEKLFNGEYYRQIVDVTDRAVLARSDRARRGGADAVARYWDREHKQIKYQIADGCGVDQVVAQWHADLYGLGEIFDPRQVRKAMRGLYRHNFAKPMRHRYNPCRIYCLNDEAGLIICTWPEGTDKPAIPLPYAQETQNGYEYAAAGLMIRSGLVSKGMDVVEAVRDRYDGEKRNPWNEFECGSNYARSMASYALLNAFSGLTFDATRQMIGFDPIVGKGVKTFRCFWSLNTAWGRFVLSAGCAEIRVLYGTLALRRIALSHALAPRVKRVVIGKRARRFTIVDNEVVLSAGAKVSTKTPLRITLS